MTFRLTWQGQSDIKEIYRYTVEYFGEDQAREYLDGLEYSFDLLTETPNWASSGMERGGATAIKVTLFIIPSPERRNPDNTN